MQLINIIIISILTFFVACFLVYFFSRLDILWEGIKSLCTMWTRYILFYFKHKIGRKISLDLTIKHSKSVLKALKKYFTI